MHVREHKHYPVCPGDLKDFYGYSTLKDRWMGSMDANQDRYVWLTLPVSFPFCLWGSFSALNVFLGNFI